MSESNQSHLHFMQLVGMANRKNSTQPKYCVKPILKTIPSFAVKWPPELPEEKEEELSQKKHASLGEGRTLIDLQVSGTFERDNFQAHDETETEPQGIAW